MHPGTMHQAPATMLTHVHSLGVVLVLLKLQM